MKIFNIDFSFNKALTKEYLILFLLFIAALTSFIGVTILGQTVYQQFTTFMQLREEINTSQAKVNLIESYSILTADEIQKNNQYLERLIPSEDTNLSMYYILDDLSARSSIEITDYQLGNTSGDTEESTVNITAVGTNQELLSFLNEYHFISGRLLTLNSIQIQKGSEENSRLNVNMTFTYYRTSIQAISNIQKVSSTNDITFLRNIRKEIEELRETE